MKNQIAANAVMEVLTSVVSNIEKLEEVSSSIEKLDSCLPTCHAIEVELDTEIGSDLYFSVEKGKFFSETFLNEARENIERAEVQMKKTAAILRDLYKEICGEISNL